MSIANAMQTSGTRTDPLAARKCFLLSAVLLVGGFIVGWIVSLFHAGGITDPNNHPAVFAIYAQSGIWTTVHLAEFIATAVTIVGLLILFYALNLADGIRGLVARVGIVSAGTTLALTAVLYAVDGVVLKRAVDAWASAPDGEKAVRFASAETVRWLEEATNSYQYFLTGLTVILVASLIVWTARIPRPIGYLLGLSGVTDLVAGWIHGAAGFAPQAVIPALLGQLCWLIAGVWLLVSAWRMPDSAEITPEGGSPARRTDASVMARS
jgi:hypothetical protein